MLWEIILSLWVMILLCQTEQCVAHSHDPYYIQIFQMRRLERKFNNVSFMRGQLEGKLWCELSNWPCCKAWSYSVLHQSKAVCHQRVISSADSQACRGMICTLSRPPVDLCTHWGLRISALNQHVLLYAACIREGMNEWLLSKECKRQTVQIKIVLWGKESKWPFL